MRWAIIGWLLLSAAADFYSVHTAVCHSRETLSIFRDVKETFTGRQYPPDKARSFDSLSQSVAELETDLSSPILRLSYGIMLTIAILAVVAAVLLATRRPLGVKLGLVALGLLLVWGVYAGFSRESYRLDLKRLYSSICESVGVLAEEDVNFSPKLDRALEPKLAISLPFRAVDCLLLLVLFRRRRTIIAKEPIQQGRSTVSSEGAPSGEP